MSEINHSRVRSVGASAVKTIAIGLAFSASFTVHSHTSEEPKNKPSTGLSRAEVIADLALWRRAGVDRYEPIARYGIEIKEYRDAYQEYLRLRNSEQFQLEVQRALRD